MADFPSHVRNLLGDDWIDFGGRIEALKQDPPFQPFGEEEAVVLAMSQWFKHDFMTWIDPIKCPKCGADTKFSGMAQPTQEELLDGAGRVESHRCVECQAERRFMRVNKVSTLLRTREGRCGMPVLGVYLATLTGRRVCASLLRPPTSPRHPSTLYLE